MEADRFKLIRIYFFAGIFIMVCFGFASAQSDIYRDSENCLMCHRYPTMGRYDKDGKEKVLYINGQEYARSVHGKVKCTNCHLGLDKIPHTDLKKVDCSTKCHINDLASNNNYSHIDVVEKYEASVHGKGPEDNPKPFPKDLPTCTYCHTNRDYYYSKGQGGKSDTSCDDTSSIFRHPSSQLRSQLDVIELCASCHENRDKMARHGLESTETYKDTFHWQQLKYGVIDSPDCINCHVPLGYSSHTISPVGAPLSPVNDTNRIKTCSKDGGIQTCHPDATPGFASGRVHTYGTKARLTTGKSIFDMEGKHTSQKEAQARADIAEKEIFHNKILKILRSVYKTLIGCTIGFMSIHQVMDYIRARKKHKISDRF